MTSTTPAADVAALSAEFVRAAERLPLLHELADAFQLRIAALIEGAENEDEAAEWEQDLARLAGDIRASADRIVSTSEWFDTIAEDRSRRAKRMATTAKRYERRAERLRNYVRDALNAIDQPRLQTEHYSLSLRLNNPSVVITDEHAVPDDFWRAERVPSNPEDRSCTECGALLVVSKTGVLTHWRATGGKSVPDGIQGGEVPVGTQVVRNQRLAVD